MKKCRTLLLSIAMSILVVTILPHSVIACETDLPSAGYDFEDYGRIHKDADQLAVWPSPEGPCALKALNTLVTKLTNIPNKSVTFGSIFAGGEVTLIFSAAQRLGAEGLATKELHTQLDQVIAAYTFHKDPTCGNDIAHQSNSCTDDYADAAAAYGWIAAYKHSRGTAFYSNLATTQSDARAMITAFFDSVCIYKPATLGEVQAYNLCNGTPFDLTETSLAHTLSLAHTPNGNEALQQIPYGFGLLTGIASGLLGLEVSGAPYSLTPVQQSIATALASEAQKHITGSPYEFKDDCLQATRLDSGPWTIASTATSVNSNCGRSPYFDPQYRPNMYALNEYGNSFWARYVGGFPSDGPYRSDSFDASLFNAAQANAFFGDGRAVFYGLQGFIWTAELAGGDNPRYMPLDENDPIGYLDSINGNGVAFGWTCDRDDVRPISMELRESAPTPTGTLYGAVRTTVASEYAVLVQCHDANGFWPHRFSFQLPPETSGHMIDVWAKDYTYYGDVKLPCSAGGTGCYTWHDTTPPVTAIISPSEGAILTGITMAVASASDNVGVILKVEFYLDGVLGRTDTDRHIWNIDTTTVANGVHTLTSKAYDLAGNVGASNPVTFTVDNQSPTTAIPAPTAGATVAGTTTVTATASDNSGVTRVEFYLDGALANTDTVSPYAWSWDTTLAVNTTYTLVSKAYDAAGNIGTSATISVTVNNVDTTAPTTAITAPTNGTSVAGTTTVTATASDNNTVARVEFYLDGALIATDTSAPYSFSWNTTSASNGSHALVSKAYDAAANAGSSTTTTVTVSNGTSDTQPPTTGITSPAYGATVSGGPTVTASASDNVGVSRVEFYLDSVLQASVTSPPYSWVWYTTSSSNGGHTLTSKAYDAAGNIGTSAATVVTIGNYPLPTASFTVNGSGTTATISSGGRVTLYWSTTNANTLTLSPTGGTTSPLARQQTGGFLTYPIYVTTTYTLTVNGNGGTITKTVRVTVQ